MLGLKYCPLMLSFQVILLAGAVSCSSAWFVGPRSTVTQLQWLGAHPASAVHQPLASCAVVESSLPPCRNVRQLRIAPSPATRQHPRERRMRTPPEDASNMGSETSEPLESTPEDSALLTDSGRGNIRVLIRRPI
ncbi:hypothetical protein AAG570_012018 [Ranatra chinensis]|uniref:Secreted protein n=1 Tax=Ranatra chinensis TaxID=642074 RepID=A0ABD0YW19_9HEMI